MMSRLFVWLFFVCINLAIVHGALATVTIETVYVGNVGNTGDPADGDKFAPGIQHLGAVEYAYRIGTYEVTNGQYAEFLNVKAKSDPLSLYSANMSDSGRGGITRSGVSGSYTYAIKPEMDNKPVMYVSWYDSIRFANWLHNGQGNGDTESGAYTLLGNTPTPSNANSITRNTGASWFLTSENEWYKAAYHQPAAAGGDVDDYWMYPTASNTVPQIATANSVGDISNPGQNVANYLSGAAWNGQIGNVTSVGSAGPLSRSYYGTYDQGGNVWEWNESLLLESIREYRGSSCFYDQIAMQPEGRYGSGVPAANEDIGLGFRVATVPEPSTIALFGIGVIALLANAACRRFVA